MYKRQIQNLPLGVFRRTGSTEGYRGGVAIGDQILDLAAALKSGVFSAAGVGPAAAAAVLAAAHPVLNEFMAAGAQAWSALRLALSRALRSGSPQQAALQPCLLPQEMCIRDRPGVARVDSSFVLRSVVKNAGLPIDG